MQVTKPLALFGFHFCTTVFIGLSVYGAARYMSEGLQQPDSLLAAGSYAAAILASIGGICFFGREADRRKSEEIRTTLLKPPSPPNRKKKI